MLFLLCILAAIAVDCTAIGSVFGFPVGALCGAISYAIISIGIVLAFADADSAAEREVMK